MSYRLQKSRAHGFLRDDPRASNSASSFDTRPRPAPMAQRPRLSGSAIDISIDLTLSDNEDVIQRPAIGQKQVIDLRSPSPRGSPSPIRQPASTTPPAKEVPEASSLKAEPANQLTNDTSTAASPKDTPAQLPKEVEAIRHTPLPQVKVSPQSPAKGKANIPFSEHGLQPTHVPEPAPEDSSSEEEEIIHVSISQNLQPSPETPSRNSMQSGRGSQKSFIETDSPLTPRVKARRAKLREKTPPVEPGELHQESAVQRSSSLAQPDQEDQEDHDDHDHQEDQGDQRTVESVATSLRFLERSMRIDHAMSTRWLLQDAREAFQNAETLVVDKVSPFASMSSVQLQPGEAIPVGFSSEKMDSWLFLKKVARPKTKQLAKHIFGDTPRVPRYSSHTNVSRNILSADSEKLKYVPYLGDTTGSANKDTNFKKLLKELEEAYSPRRIESTREGEKASRIRAYLDNWLEEGNFDCDQKALIHYLLTREEAKNLGLREDEQQMILDSFGEPLSKQAEDAGELFGDAFDEVFDVGLPNVLLPTELLKEMVESAKKKTQTSPEKSADIPGDRLGTYATLTCLICGAVDCQTHADYTHDEIFPAGGSGDDEREPEYLVQRQPLVLPYHDMIRRFNVRKKAQAQAKSEAEAKAEANLDLPRPSSKSQNACSENCWRVVDYSDREVEWEQKDLDSIHEMRISITDEDHQACHISFALGLPCWQVHGEIAEHEINNDTSNDVDEPKGRPKRPDWYDNRKKILHRDWQEMTKAHLHQERSQANPCTHDGHCTDKCPCFQANILCESFCGCADDCPRKFTGCPCPGNGLTCATETCICIQMNRECGPECISCGALDRINPINKHDDILFTHGCQNVYLQRGKLKASVMGESQLEGVGFGLYLAEPVQKGDFLSEYTGEVISSQEAERRGIIYDRKFLSFLFDLNKDYVIDAARLGNNTRFINHADNEKNGLNCEAKIILVNGEHRIKFVALRDIEVGEELLFNYGKKFAEKHGLSKKLPQVKEGGKKGVLVGEEALDALDGVDQRKKSARVKVADARGRPRGGGGGGGGVGGRGGGSIGGRGKVNKMRKTAPARPLVVVEDLVMEEASLGDDVYMMSNEGEEDEDEENLGEVRRKRKITRPARYTR